MHLMVQPEVAATRSHRRAVGQAGLHVANSDVRPRELIGKRMHKAPPPEAEQVLQQYKDRVLNIMAAPYRLAPTRETSSSHAM